MPRPLRRFFYEPPLSRLRLCWDGRITAGQGLAGGYVTLNGHKRHLLELLLVVLRVARAAQVREAATCLAYPFRLVGRVVPSSLRDGT